MQEDAQAPFDDRVAEEEKVAPPQLRGEGDRYDVRELGLREIGDVVVLADDEALTPAIGSPIDVAVNLRMTGGSSSERSPYVFGTATTVSEPSALRWTNLPRSGPIATYETMSTSSRASSKARSRARP